jgi:hypothetical protein
VVVLSLLRVHFHLLDDLVFKNEHFLLLVGTVINLNFMLIEDCPFRVGLGIVCFLVDINFLFFIFIIDVDCWLKV